MNLEENDSNNDTNFEEITSSEILQGNMDTMLIEHVNTVTEDSSDSPQDSTGNEVYTLTPGEGQILVFKDSCKVIRVEYAYNHIQVRPVYNKQR